MSGPKVGLYIRIAGEGNSTMKWLRTFFEYWRRWNELLG